MLEIEEKKLEIILKRAELEKLQQELHILEIKHQVKRPKIENGPVQKEEDDRKVYYYAVFHGPKAGIHSNFAEIYDLPVSSYAQCETKFEAEQVLAATNKKIKENHLQINMTRKINRPAQSFYEPSALASAPPPTIVDWVKVQNKGKIPRANLIPVRDDAKFNKVILTQETSIQEVQEYFESGLIHLIYPDLGMKQFMFDTSIYKTLIEFSRKKNLQQQGKHIFCKVLSTVPDWENEKSFASYHFIEIGAYKEGFNRPLNQEIKADLPKEEEVNVRRITSFCQLQDKISSINEKSQIKVNYDSGRVLIISRYNKEISKGDFKRIQAWNERISNADLKISEATKKMFFGDEDIKEDAKNIAPKKKVLVQMTKGCDSAPTTYTEAVKQGAQIENPTMDGPATNKGKDKVVEK